MGNLENLFNRLKTELGNMSDSALRKRMQRKASSMGITSEEALFVLAVEKGVGYQREFKKLPIEKQQRITQSIRATSNTTQSSFSLRKKIKKAGIITIKTQFGLISEPFLPKSINKEAVEMAEQAYLSLYVFENSVRNFVKIVMENKYGSSWWANKLTTKKLQPIQDSVADRFKREERDKWHGKTAVHPIYYSDFTDLSAIIETYSTDFRRYFANLKFKENWLLHKLSEVEPSRNVTAHHNPLGSADLSRVHGNLADWISQLEYIKEQGLL